MLAKALQDTADGLGENRDGRHVGIVLLRVGKQQGWRMTRGRQGERKRHNNKMSRDQTQ